jgi:amino acid permease
MCLARAVLTFVTSYLPIVRRFIYLHPPTDTYAPLIYKPMFLLCIFGYKLIKQTNFVELHEMDFDRGEVPPAADDHPPQTVIERIANLLVS